MRLCIIGNSHIACLKSAWTTLSKDRTEEVEFFASPLQSMTSLKRDGQKLASSLPSVTANMLRTSGGKEAIDLDDYDAVALCIGAGIKGLGYAFAQHRTLEMPSSQWVRSFVSQEFSEVIAKETLRESGSYRLARTSLSDLSVPLLIFPAPIPTPGILDMHRPAWSDAEKLYPFFQRLMRDSVTSLQSEVTFDFVHQPEETLQNGLTNRRYTAKKSETQAVFRGNATGEEGSDPHHMNTEYGAIMMTALLDQLGKGA